MLNRLNALPLFLRLVALASLSMLVPSAYGVAREDFLEARMFFYSGMLGLVLVVLIGIALNGQSYRRTGTMQLLALLGAFVLLPVGLAVPFYESIGNTSFVNAYFEMVSCLTTTGATVFDQPERLSPILHLWRAQVAWMGGLMMWIVAAAVMAPQNLGGFEVTTDAAPGQENFGARGMRQADPDKRLSRATVQLAPVYVGLTLVLWILLMIGGERPLVGLTHAMSTLSTSGISPIGGVQEGQSGFLGEVGVFLFLLFALSRITFSSDMAGSARTSLRSDPEFRLGLLLVLGVPLLLFLRHWVGAYDVNEETSLIEIARALWGGLFSVLNFVTTNGFVSQYWITTQNWSGLETPGLIFIGLALIGGGVATTAGGVKLLRVYALYLSGQREMERLVHPSSVSRRGAADNQIRKQGAFVAWIFFMLVALSIAVFTVLLAALGESFETSVLLSVSALSTTGPLIDVAAESPVSLIELSTTAKAVLCAAMVMGRLELLAIVALLTPELWRG